MHVVYNAIADVLPQAARNIDCFYRDKRILLYNSRERSETVIRALYFYDFAITGEMIVFPIVIPRLYAR